MSTTAPQLPTRPYDFTAVSVTWGTNSLTGGLVSIKVARAEDAWTYHIAADGTVTRVRNNNRMGGIELTYGPNAPALDILSAQAQLDEAAGTAMYSIEVKDGNGRTVASAPGAWIRKLPDSEFAKEATERTIAFDCDKLTYFVGGLN